MTEYVKHRQVSNSKARLIGKPQRKMKPNAKPVDNSNEEVSDNELIKSLFVGMAGCIFVLLAVIVILVLIIIFGS